MTVGYPSSRWIVAFAPVVVLAMAAPAPARSAPPEIRNLLFTSTVEARWDAEPSAIAYHVYRGSVSDLGSGLYGVCHLGSVEAAAADLVELPPVGSAHYYLVSGFDETGEGSLGVASSGGARLPATPCPPARRLFPLTPNGAASDGVTDGLEGRGNQPRFIWGVAKDEVKVNTATGEVVVASTDLSVPGRGFDWSFSRTYRSQIRYDGPLGLGWDFTDNSRLSRQGANVIYFDGTGRREVFQASGGGFVSPPGLYGTLIRTVDGHYKLRELSSYWAGAGPGAHRRSHTPGKSYVTELVLEGYSSPNSATRSDGIRGDREEEVFSFADTRGWPGANPIRISTFSPEGRLESVEDGYGNRFSYLYDHRNLLTQVVDTLGRTMTYSYLPDGRVASIADHSGRLVTMTFDGVAHGERHLVAATSPSVTGTPNGNDFPAGKTTQYSYSGLADPLLRDNLTRIVTPGQQATDTETFLAIYGPPATFEADRVTSLTIGGTNASGVPAGGTLTFAWSALNPGSNPMLLDLPRRQVTVIDRNGNESLLVHNATGHLLSSTEKTNRDLRPGEPDYTTEFHYNADGALLSVDYPGGNRAVLAYDAAGPDRYRQGNLLSLRLIADAAATGGRGDGHGGELNDRIWTFTYEPVFNRLASMTGPKGNDPSYSPPNGGSWSPERYRWQWTYDYQEGDPAANGIQAMVSLFGIVLGSYPVGLGDLNGDGLESLAIGSPIREEAPGVLLDPASHQAVIEGDTSQEIVTLWRHNAFGQLIGSTDPEGNTSEVGYHPEFDPDGDGIATPPPPDGRMHDTASGGLVRFTLSDSTSDPARNNGTNPTPVAVRTDFEYDAVGRVTGIVDGRGVLMRLVRNALGQVVEARPAAATGFSAGPFGDPATGRGEAGLDPIAARTQFSYDADDRLVRIAEADPGGTRGVGALVEREGTHDILGSVVRITAPQSSAASLTTHFEYDANGNPTRVIWPAGSADEWAYDERDLPLSSTRGASGPLGGAASTAAYDYDANGNLARLTDPEGGLVDLSYDGHDRLVGSRDQTGNTAERFLDPAGDVVRVLHRGPVGGPTPPDRTGATNVDLADARVLRDELGRVIRIDRPLFMPAGASPSRPASLTEGGLLPGDGFVNRAFEHDALSRLTFETSDSGVVTRRDYDGVSRLTKGFVLGSDAPVAVDAHYDAASNLVESVVTERSSSSGPPEAEFPVTYFYDALDRLVTTVDSLGQTHRFVWSALDDLLTVTDANGPPGGTVSRRSPAGGTVAVNAHGNVTLHAYDGLGRRLITRQPLTATGLGDGTTSPTPDTSNAFNPDGLITSLTEWTTNGLVGRVVDDRGNETTYAYDNLDRVVLVTADDGTTHGVAYDRRDKPVSITDANGSVATHAYDAAGRLVLTSVARGPDVEGTTLRAFEYDGLSRMTRLTDNNDPALALDDAEVRLVYDSLGRVVEEAQVLGPGGTLLAVDGAWLAEDLLTRLTYPSGRQVDYVHDAFDRLVGLSDSSGRSLARQQYGWSRVHTLVFDNGMRSTTLDDTGIQDIGHDGAGRTVLLRHLAPGGPGAPLVAGFEYGYDRVGNRVAERRLHHGTGPSLFQGSRYAYDSAGRMIEHIEGSLDGDKRLVGPATDIQRFTLDGAGNWPLMERQGALFTATPNNNNEYDEPQSGGTRFDDGVPDDFLDRVGTPPDGLNLAHDRNGNQTITGPVALRYDFLNRPVRAIRLSDAATIGRYAHDALGRFVWRQTEGSPVAPPPENRFVGSLAAAGVVEERDETGAVSRVVVFTDGDPQFMAGRSGDMVVLVRDDPGSVVALVGAADPTASVIERVTYDAYGKPTFETAGNVPRTDTAGFFVEQSDYGNTTLFRGMRYDPEFGARTADVTTDLGGFYAGGWGGSGYLNPNQGRHGSRDNHLQGAVDVIQAAARVKNPYVIVRTNVEGCVAGRSAYSPTLAPVNGSGGEVKWNFQTLSPGEGNPWLDDIPAASGFTQSSKYKLYSVTGQATPVGETKSDNYTLKAGFIHATATGNRMMPGAGNEGNPWLGDIAAASGFTSSMKYKLYSVTGQPTPVGETKSDNYTLKAGFINATASGNRMMPGAGNEGIPWLGDILADSGFASSNKYKLYSVTGQPTPVGETKGEKYTRKPGSIHTNQTGSGYTIADIICCASSGGRAWWCCDRVKKGTL